MSQYNCDHNCLECDGRSDDGCDHGEHGNRDADDYDDAELEFANDADGDANKNKDLLNKMITTMAMSWRMRENRS